MVLVQILGNMEGPEVTFLFQFGNLRDMVTAPAATINLKSLKDLACDFINSKVSKGVLLQLTNIYVYFSSNRARERKKPNCVYVTHYRFPKMA